MSTEPCPQWCGGGHYCTVWRGHPAGQHRSEPHRVERPWGVLVYSRVANRGDPESQLELRVAVRLAVGEPVAQHQAEQIAAEVDQAVMAGLLAGAVLDINEPMWTALGH